MSILVHAFERQDGWIIQCLADDAKTTVAPPPLTVSQLRISRAVAALRDRDRAGRWSIVSARIDLIPGRKDLLRVRAPWNEGPYDSLRTRFQIT